MNIQAQINQKFQEIGVGFANFKKECEKKQIGSVDCKWDVDGKTPLTTKYLPVSFTKIDNKEGKIELSIQGSVNLQIIDTTKKDGSASSKINLTPSTDPYLVNVSSPVLEDTFFDKSTDPNHKLKGWKKLFDQKDIKWLRFKDWNLNGTDEISFNFDIIPFGDLSFDYNTKITNLEKLIKDWEQLKVDALTPPPKPNQPITPTPIAIQSPKTGSCNCGLTHYSWRDYWTCGRHNPRWRDRHLEPWETTWFINKNSGVMITLNMCKFCQGVNIHKDSCNSLIDGWLPPTSEDGGGSIVPQNPFSAGGMRTGGYTPSRQYEEDQEKLRQEKIRLAKEAQAKEEKELKNINEKFDVWERNWTNYLETGGGIEHSYKFVNNENKSTTWIRPIVIEIMVDSLFEHGSLMRADVHDNHNNESKALIQKMISAMNALTAILESKIPHNPTNTAWKEIDSLSSFSVDAKSKVSEEIQDLLLECQNDIIADAKNLTFTTVGDDTKSEQLQNEITNLISQLQKVKGSVFVKVEENGVMVDKPIKYIVFDKDYSCVNNAILEEGEYHSLMAEKMYFEHYTFPGNKLQLLLDKDTELFIENDGTDNYLDLGEVDKNGITTPPSYYHIQSWRKITNWNWDTYWPAVESEYNKLKPFAKAKEKLQLIREKIKRNTDDDINRKELLLEEVETLLGMRTGKRKKQGYFDEIFNILLPEDRQRTKKLTIDASSFLLANGKNIDFSKYNFLKQGKIILNDFPDLEELIIENVWHLDLGNSLTFKELDVSRTAPKLKTLLCRGSENLSVLNLGRKLKITKLDLRDTALTKLDLSNTKITRGDYDTNLFPIRDSFDGDAGEITKPFNSTLPLGKITFMQTPAPIKFYDSKKPYYEFTNFYRLKKPIEIELPGGINEDGTIVLSITKLQEWITSEHLFQACKFVNDPAIAETIRTQPTAREALNQAKVNDAKKLSYWNKVNIAVMDWVLELKFQDLTLQQLLIDTGEAKLIEDAGANDAFWGNGADGKGRNELGKALMRLRTKLKNK